MIKFVDIFIRISYRRPTWQRRKARKRARRRVRRKRRSESPRIAL
jgi:hypothetical protein